VRRLTRLSRILAVGLRFGLHEFIPPLAQSRVLGWFCSDRAEPGAVRLRRALETLGPIFVKFGQVLSTRRDLLPSDIADELAKLQDQVPAFDPAEAVAEIERSLGRRIDEVGLIAMWATTAWPDEMPPRTPPEWLLKNPSGVISSRCSVPFCSTQWKPACSGH